jgi:hypothetical protein
MVPDRPPVPCFPMCPRVLYLHHFFLFLSIVCPNVFIFQNFIFMLMTCKLSGNRSDLDGLITRVTEDLEAIHRCSIDNGLLLNPPKSQAILVPHSPAKLPLSLLFLGDIALDWRDVVTDLVLLIDCRLRLERHVTKIYSRVYGTLYRLR